MYSASVITLAIERYERTSGQRLIRIDPGKTIEWDEHMASIWDAAKSTPSRKLRKEEAAYVRNQRVMGMLDFRYWAERWGTIAKDGGGVCKLTAPWESQEILLRAVARREEAIANASTRGEPVDGLLMVLHKARQLGATAIGRLLLMHRLTLQNNRRAMSASVDDDKIQELYDRDKLILDNLPWYLRPTLKYDEKRANIHFEGSDSRSLFQVSSQKSGLGVGRQFDLGHLTELSTWLNASAVELDFFPTLPASLTTLGLLESTAYGRGNWWHDFTERVRKGYSPRWIYTFIPYYAEVTKYRRQPPLGWKPSEVSMLHAQKVYDTSHEFIGHAYMLPRETLYWWESTRAEYQKGGNLSFFLTNFCSSPEESFQHSGQSAFGPELLDDLRSHARTGSAYELRPM